MSAAWAGVLVAAAALACTGLAWLARLLVRLGMGTFRFIFVEWPKALEQIAGLTHDVAELKRETQPNGGHSLRDVVHQIRRDVGDVKTEQAAVRKQLAAHQREEEEAP